MRNLIYKGLIVAMLASSFSAISQSTINISPEKDAYVRDGVYSMINNGSNAELVVKNGSPDWSRQSFLNFELSGIPEGAEITSAKLRIKISNRNQGMVAHNVQSVSNDTWGENTITWNNKPSLGSVLDQQSVGAVETWMEYDITQEAINQFSGNDYSLSVAITTSSNTNVRYYSKENTISENAPQLLINYNRISPATFYVDWFGGSDSNSGTSSSAAWKSLSRINSSVFIPGDKILLKSGGVWNGQVVLRGSGNSTNPIIVDQYSTGGKPIINGLGAGTNSEATVLLKNVEYWEVNNLELTNTNGALDYQGDLWGILGIKDDGGAANHIYIRNCYIHNVNGNVATKTTGGIYITAAGNNPAWYNDLKIENNIIENVGGLGIATQSPHASISATTRYPFLNVLMKGNTIKNTGRNNMIIRVSDDAIVEHNRLINSSRYSSGHSVFSFNTDNVKIQYNEAYGNTGSGGKDRGGFDADYNCRNTKIQYNYSHDNYWGFAIMKKGVNENVKIRYNISENDQKSIYFYGFNSSTGMTRAYIYNNTHYVRPGLDITVFGAGEFEREAFKTDFDNNIFYFGSTGSDWGQINSNVNFENNSFYNIAARGTNFITTDPQFVNPGTGGQDIDWSNYPNVLTGYQLQSTSPAIDAGKTIANNGGQDFWGNSLYNGTADIGAFEFQTSNISNLLPTDDALVRGGSYSNTNFGTNSELTVKLASPDFTRKSFLKFDLSTVESTIISAKLKLQPSSSGISPGSTNIELRFVSDDTWTENNIIWDNMPTLGNLLDSKAGSGSTTEWDVTSQAEIEREGDGILSLGLESTVAGGENFVDYHSKEGASGLQPVLVITTSSNTSSRNQLVLANNLADKEISRQIYPNPASSKLIISGLEKTDNIFITGVDGKLVQAAPLKNVKGVTIDVDHLPNGIYMLHYHDGSGKLKSKKFIKK